MNCNTETLDINAQEQLNVLNAKLAIIGCHKIDCTQCGQFYFDSNDIPICKLNPYNPLYFDPKLVSQ
jgi:hypothetical protein